MVKSSAVPTWILASGLVVTSCVTFNKTLGIWLGLLFSLCDKGHRGLWEPWKLNADAWAPAHMWVQV